MEMIEGIDLNTKIIRKLKFIISELIFSLFIKIMKPYNNITKKTSITNLGILIIAFSFCSANSLLKELFLKLLERISIKL